MTSRKLDVRLSPSKPPVRCRLCLGNEQPFFAFQALSQTEHGERLHSVEAMAAHYVNELLSLQRTGPYHLGGYSMGGVIAYEMAQQLRRAGHDVPVLAVIDQTRP